MYRLAIACLAAGMTLSVQATKLDNSLTPLGAERAGSSDGLIPAWTGGITQPPAGYTPGMHHPDPYADDQPRLVISPANLDEHRTSLPAGLQQMLQTYLDYSIRVFPTRRSAAVPQRIYDATRKNATQAKLISRGNGVQGTTAGIPFPRPESGLEVIWNHIMRYRGDQVRTWTQHAAVLPGGKYALLKRERDILFRYGQPGLDEKDLNNTLLYYKYRVMAPSALAGTALLVQETIDQILAVRKAWRYDRGERRVRRLPSLAYDALQPDTSGMATADVVDAYNGAPDRYEWTLVGKQPMIVPYNSYQVHQQGIPYEQILQPAFVNPQLLRYELHRVWIVEANLRKDLATPTTNAAFILTKTAGKFLQLICTTKKANWSVFRKATPLTITKCQLFSARWKPSTTSGASAISLMGWIIMSPCTISVLSYNRETLRRAPCAARVISGCWPDSDSSDLVSQAKYRSLSWQGHDEEQ